jgi:GntR family transcriptional regulator / MocR family aminotransferase
MSQLAYLERVSLDRSGSRPLADQIVETLASLIDGGLLEAATRLPTTRQMAAALGVNRAAVLEAIRRLKASGRVETRIGSGTVVRSPQRAHSPSTFEPPLSAAARRVPIAGSAAPVGPLLADFSQLSPDERFFPTDQFEAMLAGAWKSAREIWQYGSPYGHVGLRRLIAERLAAHGPQRDVEEVLITSGAQQGLDLLFKTFVDVSSAVAVESPTYSGILSLLRFYGASVLPLPMNSDGPSLEAISGRAVRLLYTTPERQNPTGVTISDAVRRRMVGAAIGAGALIVEDSYDNEPSRQRSFASHAKERTISVGTLSKDLAPGFRIGWIAADQRLLEPIARIKQTADFQTPLPLQAAVARFLEAGCEQPIRAARSRAVEARRRAMEKALARYLPDVPYWGGDAGSAIFWLRPPLPVSGREVAAEANRVGVRLAPGADFDPEGRDRSEFRLSVTRVDETAIESAVARLAEAYRRVVARIPAVAAPPTV